MATRIVTKSGKLDMRTNAAKAICKNLAKARKAAAKNRKLSKGGSVMRTKDGTLDKRTKEGKAVCARMAKARRAKGSLKNRIKRLFR